MRTRGAGSGRTDWVGIAAVLLPLLVRLPLLLGLVVTDPFALWGEVSRDPGAATGGHPSLDPNMAYTSHALGSLAAALVRGGHVPWWNHYEGMGMPLAGEMQSAALFPPTWLMAVPDGQLIEHLLFQMIAAAATYALLRRIGTGRAGAWLGATAFAFNGTFAWLGNAACNPVCFLPVIVLGVERLRAGGRGLDRVGGIMVLGGVAASLYAGFPETAYLDALLVALWTAVRVATARAPDWRLLGRSAVAAVIGVLLAAPLLVAFADFLAVSEVGGHGAALGATSIPPAFLVDVYLPYYFRGPLHPAFWANAGGYGGLCLTVLATLGAIGRRERALRRALAGWVMVCLLVTFGATPVIALFHLVPFTRYAALYRYLDPAWELALAILAALAIDDLRTGALAGPRRRWALLAAVALPAGAVGLATVLDVKPVGASAMVVDAAAVAMLVGIAVLAGRRTPPGRRAVWAIAALAGAEAVMLFAGSLSRYGRRPPADLRAVHFLQGHLGLQRFVTTGPIAANFGSCFGIAQVNHNDLPVPADWVRYAHAHLDPRMDPISLGPTETGQVARARAGYEAIGTRYVVTRATQAVPGLPIAYRDEAVAIAQLPRPAPYLSAPGCRVAAPDRDTVAIACAHPSRLRRLELFMPGWTASVNGTDTPVARAAEIFQEVAVPAGRSSVGFRFVPPLIVAGLLAAMAGVAILIGWMGGEATLAHRAARRPRGSNFPAARPR